jgi:hypothetical protein
MKPKEYKVKGIILITGVPDKESCKGCYFDINKNSINCVDFPQLDCHNIIFIEKPTNKQL